MDIGDVHIGHALAHAPADDTGWPPAAVRDLFEQVQNEKIESGFRVEVQNQRGVTSRGLTEGGEQELDLVRKYREQAAVFADKWPRTSAILRRLADAYERQARQQDEESERFRRGLER